MKKQILRKCLSTNKVYPREELFRIVKTPEGEIKLDLSNRLNGRGVYLLKDKEAINKAKGKDLISRAFEKKCDLSIYDEMINLL